MVVGGILPFGAVFIELYFIMSSVWLQRFYYVFGECRWRACLPTPAALAPLPRTRCVAAATPTSAAGCRTGFLALVLLILLITCAEMAIVLTYFQLCNENYQWQWRAFLNTGSAGLFLFGYSFVYFSSTLEIMGVVSTMLYFTYMFVASMLFTLVTGTVGYFSSWWFVIQIYGAVKVD